MIKKLILTALTTFGLIHHSNSQQINSFSPKNIIGGKGEILTITGSGFGNIQGNSYVSFFQESNTYSDATTSNQLKYLSWSNTEIKLEMPVAFSNKIKLNINGNEYFSSETLKVNANLGYRNVNPLIYNLLTDNNKKGGVTWFVHPVYWNNPEIKEAIADVMREFRCKTGANYIIEPLTKWVPLNLNQGIHILAPDSSLNVVGFNDKLWTSCILGTETFYNYQTQLLRFSTTQNWYYGKGQPPSGTAKFRYVLYHEIGHSLGLGHVNELGESMYPSVTNLPSDNWCSRDSITSSEQKAIQHYIQLSQNFTFRACGINPMKQITNCEDVYNERLQVKETEFKREVLYPNPAKNYIQINLLSEVPTDIEIRNIFGKICLNTKIESSEKISLPLNLPSGLYMVSLKSVIGQSYHRLIIQ
jgi:hypothetical protein